MSETKVREPSFYAALDPGIRFAVRVLHAAGIDTGQSCQGGEGHSYDRPSVDLWSDTQTTGFAAYHALAEYGLPVHDISRVWRAQNGELVEPLWRITFRKSMEDRQDGEPMFVWSVASSSPHDHRTQLRCLGRYPQRLARRAAYRTTGGLTRKLLRMVGL